MELLPIIYWSLIGVGLLAVIVIVFSYITFNVRKKMGNIPSTEIKGASRDKKIKVTNPDKKPAEKRSHHPKVKTRSKLKGSEQKEKKKTTSSSNTSSGKLYKRPTKEEKKSRIEIVNAPKGDPKYHSMDINPKRDGWN
ncbi:MAG: hypothetical protein L3J41_00935 [Melioribacteraceae bacterium]|nr:hypothetical protein [Melioribacteraceae bacterium]